MGVLLYNIYKSSWDKDRVDWMLDMQPFGLHVEFHEERRKWRAAARACGASFAIGTRLIRYRKRR